MPLASTANGGLEENQIGCTNEAHPRRNSRSWNCGLPPSSKQTISPSSTADRVLISAPITSFKTEKDLNSFPLREMSLQLSVLDLSQRAKAVPFDLKKPIGMAEGSASATERHSLEMREGHSLYYKGSKSSKRNRTQGKALGI